MATNWDFGVVAFLDVLGFAQFVESDARAPTPIYLNKLVESLSEARKSTPLEELELRSFSDSIVVTSPLDREMVIKLVSSVIGLQRAFVARGVLVRGGLAFGKHYADAESMYSEALVRAYRIERDLARFPRVVIDEQLIDWFVNDESAAQGAKGEFRALLLKDRDGAVFANYLDHDLIAAHAALIASYELDALTASVLEKLQWLATYHNHVATAAGDPPIADGPLVAGFRKVE